MRNAIIAFILVNLAYSAGPVFGDQPAASNTPVYQVPAPAQLAAPPKFDPAHPSALTALRVWFDETIRTSYAAVSKQVEGISAKDYNDFLAKETAKAGTCVEGLPPELGAGLNRLGKIKDVYGRARALFDLVKHVQGQPPANLECLEASLMEIDSAAILAAGAIVQRTSAGDAELVPVLPKGGRVFILQPQMVTAWPGMATSPTGILDPRTGPWQVVAALTREPNIEMHNQPWKSQPETSVADLQAQRSSIYLLLAAGGGPGLLGWVPLDQVVFFHADWSGFANESREAFRTGVAAFLQGTWWNPKGRLDDPRSASHVRGGRYQDVVHVMDFLHMIEGETPTTGASYLDPYPDTLQLTLLSSLRYQEDRYGDYPALLITTERRSGPTGEWMPNRSTGTIRYDPPANARSYDPKYLIYERSSTALARATDGQPFGTSQAKGPRNRKDAQKSSKQ